MPFVLDASTTVAWRLGDETEYLTRTSLDRLENDRADVPAIWWFEVRNALLVQERHGHLDPTETAAFLAELRQLPIQIDRGPDEQGVLALARAHRLSVYDAAYLELAARLKQPLATLDKRLAAAAKRADIALIEEHSS